LQVMGTLNHMAANLNR